MTVYSFVQQGRQFYQVHGGMGTSLNILSFVFYMNNLIDILKHDLLVTEMYCCIERNYMQSKFTFYSNSIERLVFRGKLLLFHYQYFNYGVTSEFVYVMTRSHQIICSRLSDRTAKNWVQHPLLPTVRSQSDRTVGSKFMVHSHQN